MLKGKIKKHKLPSGAPSRRGRGGSKVAAAALPSSQQHRDRSGKEEPRRGCCSPRRDERLTQSLWEWLLVLYTLPGVLSPQTLPRAAPPVPWVSASTPPPRGTLDLTAPPPHHAPAFTFLDALVTLNLSWSRVCVPASPLSAPVRIAAPRLSRPRKPHPSLRVPHALGAL